MSKFKPTPGPWTYSYFDDYAGKRFYIAQADGAPFTPSYSDVCTTVNGEDLEIGESNAKLISKAPEMFELLKRAEALIPETYTDEHMLCEEIRQLTLEIEGE